MLSRFLSLFLVLFLVTSVISGTTGKIAGLIVDKSTGTSLPGVNVVIEDLAMGASSDLNGEYFIINVPVGTHKITVSYVGYKTLEYEGAKVETDRTLGINFELEETVMDIGEVIVVEAERERIKKDLTMSSQYVDKDEMQILPITDFEDAAQLTAGAVGSNFRGGRVYEAMPVVDGVSTKDPSAGYMQIKGENEIQSSLLIPQLSIEQMEVITGGFNAEYGNAQSAVINVVTREGGAKHSGRITARVTGGSYVEKRYQYQDPSGQFVLYRDNFLQEFFDNAQPPDSLLAQGVKAPYIMDPANSILSGASKPYYELDNYDRKDYDFVLSGPVPFTSDKLRYSVSGQIIDNPQRRLEYNGPWFQGSFQGKLTYRISPQYKLTFNGIGSWLDARHIAYIDSKFPGGYMPGYGYMAPKPDTEEYEFNRNYLGNIKWTHTISDKTFYEVTAGYKRNTFERKDKDWNDRDGDGDTDEFLEWKYIMVPENLSDPNTTWKRDLRYKSDDMVWQWVGAHEPSGWEGGWKWTVPGVSDWKEVWALNKTTYEYRKEWRYLTGTMNERELTSYPISEEIESSIYPTVPDGYFDYYGDGYGQYNSENDVYDIKADFTSQITPQHLIKAGVSFSQTNWDFLTVGYYSTSNIYIDEFNVKPWDLAGYIQDKMEFQGMIFNLGMRFDYYNQGSDVIYPGDLSDPVDLAYDPGEPGYIKDPQKAEPFLYVSPRLGISHPITENSVLHFSYGHFYQRPEYRFWFENIDYDYRGQYAEMGNPSMKPEHTISYEIGLQQNMGDYLLGLTAFYKDIANLVNQVEAGTAPLTNFWIYANRDWASVRGFEISLRKFFSNYFSANFNYTYMIAKGKASSPSQGGSELWRKLAGVQEAYPLDWDRRHTVNANVTFSVPRWGDDWDGYLFGDWALNLLFTYGSPKPYTPPTRDPQPQYNTKRLTEELSLDFKLEKRFALSGNMRALLFFEGRNLFNRQNLVLFDGGLTNLDDISWLEETGTYEGRNLNPFAWGPRRHFRLGLGFEF